MTTAVWSDALVDCYAVNTHLSFTDTVYYSSFTSMVATRMAAAGIRYIRDGLYYLYSPGSWQDNMKTLLAAGVKLMAIVQGGTGGTGWAGASSATQWVSSIQGYVTPAQTLQFEGLNEFNLVGGSTWPALQLANQIALYNAIQANGAYPGIPILSPSLGFHTSNQILADAAKMGATGIGAYCTQANAHPYSGGADDNAGFAVNLQATLLATGLPATATQFSEFGMHTAYAVVGGGGVSELAQAKYTLRQYLDLFQLGVIRGFNYELLDEKPDTNGAASPLSNPQYHYGWIRNDNSIKPAWTSVSNWIALLSDVGGVYNIAKSLNYSFSGTTTNLKSQLMYRTANRRFYLALWLDVASWDLVGMVDINTSQSVTVTWGFPPSQVQTFVPSSSTTGGSVVQNASSYTLNVTDDVTLLEIIAPGSDPLQVSIV